MARTPNKADPLEQVNRELVNNVRQGDICRTKVLIASGADVNSATPRTGYTALMWVISKYNVPDQAVQIAKELIDAGADVNAKDNNGMSALDWARFHRDRLCEPRSKRIAQQVVSILESAVDPLRRLEAAGFTREQAKAIGDYVSELLAKAILAEAEDATDRDSSQIDVPLPGPRKRGVLQHQVSQLMHVLLDRRWGLVDEAELERWRDADYCQHTLGLKIGHMGLLREAKEGLLDRKGHGRYWSEAYHGRWLVCSQWWKMDHAWNASALTRLCTRVAGSAGDRVPSEVFEKLRAIERGLATLAGRRRT